jgi:HD-GYP domain-containing protein (c-di-GMP phosphodiesterase class II)/DNA-binding CsgD family transcriptional regulator
VNAAPSLVAHPGAQGLRLAELMVALSMATDLAMGQPVEYAMATCMAAMRLGEAAGLAPDELRDAYYGSLLRYVGCNADAAWLASMAGDEIEMRRAVAQVDAADDAGALRALLQTIRAASAGASPLAQLRAMVRAVLQVPQLRASFFPGHCEVASRLAQRMGFAPSFVAMIGQLYARWDGKGVPPLKGEAIAPAMQVVSLAQDAVIFLRAGGIDAVRRMLSGRSGKAHSPHLCALLERKAGEILEGLEGEPRWEDVLALEPRPQRVLDEAQLDAACEAMADYVDLKSPWHLGHSRRVAELAAAAGARLSLPGDEVALLRRAGWLHDIGRCGVSAAIGNSALPMSGRQWEQMRLHPYYTERILARPAQLAKIGTLAAAHHERADGSGYSKGLRPPLLDATALVLIAAHRYCSLREERAHRGARSDVEAAQTMMNEVHEGQLDAAAVDAVLASAGHAVRLSGPARPAGLTDREIEVLRLLARGSTLKMVARDLGLAVKTVDRHVQNIYVKAGVSTRAGATLFAVENHLLDRR